MDGRERFQHHSPRSATAVSGRQGSEGVRRSRRRRRLWQVAASLAAIACAVVVRLTQDEPRDVPPAREPALAVARD
jgi:hypothetical protein